MWLGKKLNRNLNQAPVAREVARAAQLLSEANHPLMIVGGGFEQSAASAGLLSNLAKTLAAPVVMTHNGKGANS